MLLKNYSLFLILACCVCMACNTQTPEWEKDVSVPAAGWDKSNTIQITLPVGNPNPDINVIDTVQYYNLKLNVRNRANYSYSNLYLFVEVTAPSGAMVTDTVEYQLADSHGKWLGKGSSKLWDNRFPFRNNIKFAAKGNYTFKIRHGMRNDELVGITSVGLRLEKVEE